jgi:pyruvate dehydrogenase (quinone)
MSEFGRKLRAGWSLACPVSGGPDTGAAPAHGFRVTKSGELHAEINEAFKADGPAIVDVVVAADAMPNLPHISLETVGHYAVAKIKEAVLAVTGS